MSKKIAIIGAGFMGETHAKAYEKGLPAQVKYVLATRQARAEALATQLRGEVIATTDYEQILDDPEVDAIDICTPTDTHRELVMRAAAAGKHVLCEKPIALTIADADAMRDACRKHGVIFMVAHVLRFWPEYVEGARLTAEGAIGTLQRIACWRFSQGPKWTSGENWFMDFSRSGGAIIDLAIHDFDTINWLAGMPRKVAAMGDVRHFSAIYELESGCIAQVEASNRMPAGLPFRMGYRLVGDGGMIEFDGSGGSLLVVRDGKAEKLAVEGSRSFAQNVAGAELDGYFYQLQYFVECLEKGVQPERGTPEEGTQALMIALQTRDALTDG